MAHALQLVCFMCKCHALRREDIYACTRFSQEKITHTYWNSIKPTRARGSFMNSFTFASEALCSVYALTTMLAWVRNTWIIHYNKRIHIHYILSGVGQLENIIIMIYRQNLGHYIYIYIYIYMHTYIYTCIYIYTRIYSHSS